MGITLMRCFLIKMHANLIIMRAINLLEKIDLETKLARRGKLIIVTFSHPVGDTVDFVL